VTLVGDTPVIIDIKDDQNDTDKGIHAVKDVVNKNPLTKNTTQVQLRATVPEEREEQTDGKASL